MKNVFNDKIINLSYITKIFIMFIFLSPSNVMANDFHCHGSFFGNKTPQIVFPNKVMFNTFNCFADDENYCLKIYSHRDSNVNQVFYKKTNKLIIKYIGNERHYECKEKLN